MNAFSKVRGADISFDGLFPTLAIRVMTTFYNFAVFEKMGWYVINFLSMVACEVFVCGG